MDLTGRRVVVIGGGRVAERKVRGLTRCRAEIRVVSPRLTPGLRRLAAAGLIRHDRRRWRPADLRRAWLVYAATDDRAVNHEIAVRARAAGRLVNVADRPDEGNAILPSVLRRGDLLVAISTGGLSPALARTIRRDLARQFGPEYRAFLALLGQARRRLGQAVATIPAARRLRLRRILLKRLVASEVLTLLRRGDRAGAVRLARRMTGQAALRPSRSSRRASRKARRQPG